MMETTKEIRIDWKSEVCYNEDGNVPCFYPTGQLLTASIDLEYEKETN